MTGRKWSSGGVEKEKKGEEKKGEARKGSEGWVAMASGHSSH